MFKNSIKVLTVAAAAAALVACGGGSDGFIAKDRSATINAANAAVLTGDKYEFTGKTFGVDGPVKIKLPANGVGQATLEGGGNTSTADFSFGSCVFNNITPAFGNLTAGKKYPCEIIYKKPGQASGTVHTVLAIDGQHSNGATTATASVNSNGQLVVGSTVITGGGN